MSEASGALQDLVAKPPQAPPSFRATVSRNIAASLVRVLVVSLVGLVLPAYLTDHLPVASYAAWVLILQLGAYVSYLDLGIQTGIAKFVAEYDAKGDRAGAAQHATAGFVMMTIAGILGIGLSFILAWQVPRLFATMPSNLYHDVRISLVLVGSSMSFGLVCAIYSAIFIGLQRYRIPMSIAIMNRIFFAGIVLAVVALHRSLVAMSMAVAFVNVLTGLLQLAAWRKYARRVRVAAEFLKYRVVKSLARYCSLQSIWTFGMLCVSGLDITIVGHYDYAQTAFYSIAVLPTNFVLLIVSSMLNPLMPASSAMSTHRSPAEMGDLLARTTRYTTAILLLTGLPLIVCGLPLLRLWVGPAYAGHTIAYLRILILANIIRNLCAPYATMITAIGKQGSATITALTEAAVNLGSSIYLASRFGAIGVAAGTLLGSFVSVGLHFAVTMRFTRRALAISRSRLFVEGILRPFIVAVPSLVFLTARVPTPLTLVSPVTIIWAISTAAFAWIGTLSKSERDNIFRAVGSRGRTISNVLAS
jgi:O-antigen/teichoic acid export membrane protein